MSLIRLNKYLANLGIASRRKIDEMIDYKQIMVNGKIVPQGIKIDPQKDKLTVNGRPVQTKQSLIYIILNKPKGIISTAIDTHNRQTVLDLVKFKERLYPVGRLDQDSQGLILLTNDGDLTYKLTHPKFHIPKTYHVSILGKVKQPDLFQLREGIELEDSKTAPADVKIIKQEPQKTILEMTLYEGKKRQIRRMAAALHLFITELKRVSMGSLKLENLEEGKYRTLTTVEVKNLQKAVNK